MNKMQPLLVVAVLLLLNSCLTSAKIVDGSGVENYDIARALCQESSTARISNANTIFQMEHFFRTYGPESELNNCRKHYEKPLAALKSVLEAGKDNFCSKKKVDAVEKFHWNYIVPSLSHKWVKASLEPIAPEPLRVFFMHYAYQIAEKCKDLLPQRLNEAIKENKHIHVGQVHDDSEFNKSLFGMITELTPSRKITNYDSFTLIWSQLIAKEKRKGHYYDLYTDKRTGEKIVGLMKVLDASKAWAMQTKCRKDLRPLYANTVLPVMKLIEMGYGTVSPQSEELFANINELRNWYAIVQVCEVLIPITFYEDPKMKKDRAVLLKNPEDAAGLRRQSVVYSIDTIMDWNEMNHLTMGDLVESADDSSVAQRVKKNIDKRNKSLKQVVKNVFNILRTQLTSKVKHFFMAKNNKKEEESGDQFLERSEYDIKSEIEAFDGVDILQHDTGRYVKTDDASALAGIQYRKLSFAQKVLVVFLMLVAIACFVGVVFLAWG